ncbi:MAG: Ig-like domain-containing protein [Planctomycetota bacterium]|jgi:hypothetical protein
MQLTVPGPVDVGDDAILRAQLRDSDGAAIVGREVTFTVNDNEVGKSKTDTAGRASVNFSPASAGSQSVIARYAGDNEYKESSAAKNFEARKAQPPVVTRKATSIALELPDAAVDPGDKFAVRAVLKAGGEPVEGKAIVVMIDDEKAGEAKTDAAGEASIEFEMPAGTGEEQGPLAVRAEFAGDTQHQESSAAGEVRRKQATKLDMTLPEGVFGEGDAVDVRVRLGDAADEAIAGRMIAISVGGSEFGTQETNDAGEIEMQLKFAGDADMTVKADFAGDADYQASSAEGKVHVKRAARIVLTVPAEVRVNETITAKAQLVDARDRPLGMRTMAVFMNGKEIARKRTDTAGEIAAEYTPTEAVAIKLRVEFEGDATNGAAKVEQTVRVSLRDPTRTATSLRLTVPADPVTPGAEVKLSAVISGPNLLAGLDGFTVTFAVGGKKVGEDKTDRRGVASVTIKAPSTGNYEVQAGFGGNAKYAESSADGKLTVRGTTSLKLTYPAEIRAGDDVAFGAELRSSADLPIVGAKVALSLDGKRVGEEQTDRAGKIAVTIPAPPAGSYKVRAEFAGDLSNDAASATATIEVGKPLAKIATTLKLVLPTEPAQAGDPVSISAKIAAEGLLAPSGFTIVFMAEGREVGRAVTTKGGSAAVTFQPMKAGALEITAGFGGDAKYDSSSATGVLNVEPAPEANGETSVFYVEMLEETIDRLTGATKRTWALQRYDIETGTRKELARSIVTSGGRLGKVTGTKPVARVIDGKLYINGFLADRNTGKGILDRAGNPIPQPKARFKSRIVSEDVTARFGGRDTVLGTRRWLVIDEMDPATGAKVRELDRQLRASTVADTDLAAIEKELRDRRLLDPREFEKLTALVEEERRMLLKWKDVSEAFVADGEGLFFRRDPGGDKVEIVMIDASARERQLRSVRTLGLPRDRTPVGLVVVGNRALVLFKGQPSMYANLESGETKVLGFEAMAIMPPEQS